MSTVKLLPAGMVVFTTHANESVVASVSKWLTSVGSVYLLKDIAFPGIVARWTPFGISTFMVKGIVDWMLNRSPSMNSASWIPLPPVALTVRVAPCPYCTKILVVSADLRPRSMYSPSKDVILIIRVLFSVLRGSVIRDIQPLFNNHF
jgi:hypothetical protein